MASVPWVKTDRMAAWFRLGFATLCILVGTVRRRRCPSVAIMPFSSSSRSIDAISIVKGHVEVCLRRIFLDSVGSGLRWICLDSADTRDCWSICKISLASPAKKKISLAFSFPPRQFATQIVVVVFFWSTSTLVASSRSF